MGFKDKLQTAATAVSEKIQTSSLKTAKILSKNKDLLKVHEKMIAEDNEMITILKSFNQEEEKPLQAFLLPFSETLSKIQTQRQQLVEGINENLFPPLDYLVQKWLELQEVIKKEDRCAHTHEKAKAALEKKRLKFQETPDKMKPGEMDNAATAVQTAFDEHQTAQKELADIKQKYGIDSLQKMKEFVNQYIEQYGKFYQNAVNLLADFSDTVH